MKVHWVVWREHDAAQARADALGYMSASVAMMRALMGTGVEMAEDPAEADVLVFFCHPITYLHYHPWVKHLKAKHVLITMFEGNPVPPEFGEAFRLVDAVISPTKFVQKELFSSHMPRGAHSVVVPLGFDRSIWRPTYRSIPEDGVFRFLYCGAPNIRKGWDRCVSIWNQAFKNSTSMHLTLKTTTSDPEKEALTHHGNMTLDTRYLTRPELAQVFMDHHCLLAPSMGEGFGLVPLEALATAMPIIATRYGGVLDFLGPQNAFFCKHDMDRVKQKGVQGPSRFFYGACARPADIGRKMVEVMMDYPGAVEKALLGAEMVHREFSMGAVGRKLRHALDEMWTDWNLKVT